MVHRSAMRQPCRLAISRTCMVSTADLPLISRSTGNAFGSKPVNTITVAPAAVSLATAVSNVAARSSGSVRGLSRSLPPAARLTRSGDIPTAAGTCSSSTSPSSLPRIARFA